VLAVKDNKERRANHSPFLFKQNNMITDILKERQKDQAPRFFLHDEMTIWLREHLRVAISDQIHDDQWVDSVAEAGTAYAYREQLKLSGKRNIYFTPMIAGAMMPTNGFEIDLSPYRSAIVSLTKRVEYLEKSNQDLRNFINQLESRIIKLEQHANI
jgi:hypothetical protein